MVSPTYEVLQHRFARKLRRHYSTDFGNCHLKEEEEEEGSPYSPAAISLLFLGDAVAFIWVRVVDAMKSARISLRGTCFTDGPKWAVFKKMGGDKVPQLITFFEKGDKLWHGNCVC